MRLNKTGNYNFAVGCVALYKNTTGSFNVAIGCDTLKNNTIGGHNNAIGALALYTNTEGLHNNATGYQSLYKNTEGDYNSAIGYRALYCNTTGCYNNAIGLQALCLNTTGQNNAAIGCSALNNNTTGSCNIAIGLQALCGALSGCHNFAAGNKALCSNWGGSHNIGIGCSVLQSNTTGNCNIALGVALGYNTTGTCNVAIGQSAGYYNTTGGCNVAIGVQALYGNQTNNGNNAIGCGALASGPGADNNALGLGALYGTTGDNNTGIGVRAGCNNGDGDCNVFFGAQAGQFLANGMTSLTSPDNSTYIGAETRGYATTDSNVTVIGYQACGCGNNTVSIGNGSVSATHLNGTSVVIAGALSKGSGTFNINHPLPALSATKRLVHSFIEGPQADNIYSGVVQLTAGCATINIDSCANMTEGTFVALNRCTRTFVNNESNWDPVRARVLGNTVTVESCVSSSMADVSWMVIGERQDTHMIERTGTDSTGRIITELDAAD